MYVKVIGANSDGVPSHLACAHIVCLGVLGVHNILLQNDTETKVFVFKGREGEENRFHQVFYELATHHLVDRPLAILEVIICKVIAESPQSSNANVIAPPRPLPQHSRWSAVLMSKVYRT